MNVKDIFDSAENGVLTWAQFEAAANAGGAKFTDLSEGQYVAKKKYDDDIASRDSQISTLNGNLSARDNDLNSLRTQLQNAGNDANALTDVSNQLNSLQSKYDKDTKEYQKQLRDQAYKFAVQRFVDTKQFTSKAAKRDFTAAMMAKNLQIENDVLIGADDFVTLYSADNADAFKVEEEPAPAPVPNPAPSFVQPSGNPNPPSGSDNPFTGMFTFRGVRNKD